MRLATRCGVETKRPLVQRCIMSAMLMTKLPGIGVARIQRPARLRTSSPPISSCSRMVNAPVSGMRLDALGVGIGRLRRIVQQAQLSQGLAKIRREIIVGLPPARARSAPSRRCEQRGPPRRNNCPSRRGSSRRSGRPAIGAAHHVAGANLRVVGAEIEHHLESFEHPARHVRPGDAHRHVAAKVRRGRDVERVALGLRLRKEPARGGEDALDQRGRIRRDRRRRRTPAVSQAATIWRVTPATSSGPPPCKAGRG